MAPLEPHVIVAPIDLIKALYYMPVLTLLDLYKEHPVLLFIQAALLGGLRFRVYYTLNTKHPKP